MSSEEIVWRLDLANRVWFARQCAIDTLGDDLVAWLDTVNRLYFVWSNIMRSMACDGD